MRKIADVLELRPLVEGRGNPVRKILRCPTKGKEPNEEPGSSHIQPSNASIPKFSFGPVYGADDELVKDTKEKAWEKVLKKSSEKDTSKIKEIYSRASRIVEKEVKLAYDIEIPGAASDFRWMMIKDGCFFLQLALLILGTNPGNLGYPQDDPIFGSKQYKIWIESMFFVGNQIPLVFLYELMRQDFFQKAIQEENYDAYPSSLCKKVLYELLVLPSLKKRSKEISCAKYHHHSDLLHGLQNLVIGPEPPGSLSTERQADDDIDLEANEEDMDIDEETIASGNDADNQKRIFPSATELKQAGIHIKKLDSGGVRGIHFKSCYLWAYLYMPAFSVDGHTEIIFRNLKTYETSLQLRKKNLICSYLKVMSDLTQTTRDVKLLDSEDVIEGSPNNKEILPRILSRLSSEACDMTNEFRILERKIRDYSSPLVHYKSVVNVVLILTLLQTILALLSYFRPTTK